MRVAVIVTVLLTQIVCTAGCERITGPSELARRVAAEQKVIAGYAEHVAKVDELQATFVDSWQKANEHRKFKDHKHAIETIVMPALRGWVGAVRQMPADSEDLTRIHALLVEAYDSSEAAFDSYLEGLTSENLPDHYKVLLESMGEVARKEARYRTELEVYYNRNQVRLDGP